MTGPAVLDCEDVAWFRDDDSLPAAARRAAEALARRVGLSDHRASEVALAVSEAATNLRRHAVDGSLVLRVLRTDSRAAVEFLTVDTGPGIADLTAALSDGESTAGTLGLGLGAMARLADTFDIHSIPGRGTVLAAQFWPRSASDRNRPGAGTPAGRPVAAGITRPISGEEVCGDAWAVRVDPGGPAGPGHATTDTGVAAGRATGTAGGRIDWSELTQTRPPTADAPTAISPALGPAVLVMLCDGLGHGPLAARASREAVTAFHRTRAHHPEAIMRDLHTALRGTRGGAVAVARIEPAAQRVLFCGVGNASAFLLTPGSRTGLLSVPGILGHQTRGLRTFEHRLPPDGALVLHSDGLTERWSMDSLPGLLQHTPSVIAGQLLREAAVRHDDAGIVVVKGAW